MTPEGRAEGLRRLVGGGEIMPDEIDEGVAVIAAAIREAVAEERERCVTALREARAALAEPVPLAARTLFAIALDAMLAQRPPG